MKIVAVVPIKLNNSRLPGKNIKLLSNKPLISYILEKLNSCKNIDKIFVFCSDDKIIPYLKNKAVFLKRDKKLNSDSTNFSEIFDSFRKKINADIYVYAHATSPLLKSPSIEECIKKVRTGNYDSAFTAKRIQTFAWIDGKPNYNLKKLPRTQDLKPILIETSGVYVFKKEVFDKYHTRIGKKPYIHIVSDEEGVDVDEQKDFDFAQYLLHNKKTI